MTLWLDDVREPWRYGHTGALWAKTADEAISLLKEHGPKITFISLDHDLAPEHYCPEDKLTRPPFGSETGLAVAQFIVDMGWWPERGVNVHSMNPVGSRRMFELLYRHHEDVTKQVAAI